MIAAHRREPSLFRRQVLTVALLFLGYAGYYFCRSDLSVAMPLITDELRSRGVPLAQATIGLGTLTSFGVLAYAIGKFALPAIADFTGGRRNFLGGMAGAIFFTVLFTLGGSLPIFTLAWVGNRLLQSAGWAGLVKIASRWFDYSSYGTVMAILSISYLVGDAVARQFMGAMIHAGVGWRGLFWFAAGFLFLILILNLFFLAESRMQLNFSEPVANPRNVFREQRDDVPTNISALIGPLLRSGLFWLVCFLSLGCTLVRESFNTWTPTYFNQFLGFSKSDAASWSSLFPAIGAISVLLAGWLSDRLGASGRAAIMCVGLGIAAAALFGLDAVKTGGTGYAAVTLVGAVAFGLLGPYSYLAGAMAMDFGGKQGGAVSSGLIDGIGYLGGVLAGNSIARIAVAFGWQRAFLLLALVSSVSAIGAAVLYWAQKERKEALAQ